jgi:hypothetical protein
MVKVLNFMTSPQGEDQGHPVDKKVVHIHVTILQKDEDGVDQNHHLHDKNHLVLSTDQDHGHLVAGPKDSQGQRTEVDHQEKETQDQVHHHGILIKSPKNLKEILPIQDPNHQDIKNTSAVDQDHIPVRIITMILKENLSHKRRKNI